MEMTKSYLDELNAINQAWNNFRTIKKTRQLSIHLKIPIWFDGHFFFDHL